MDERLIYINIGWMKTYRGDPGDPTLGGHGYLRKNFQGHETWNFLDTNGRLYGYIPRSANVLLVRLGADRRATELEDVTVIWLARNPIDKRTYVVGWYRGATIGNKHDHYKIDRPGIGAVEYQITAPAGGALLLPPDQRTFRIPTAKEKGTLGRARSGTAMQASTNVFANISPTMASSARRAVAPVRVAPLSNPTL